jgi:hypothetical protein
MSEHQPESSRQLMRECPRLLRYGSPLPGRSLISYHMCSCFSPHAALLSLSPMSKPSIILKFFFLLAFPDLSLCSPLPSPVLCGFLHLLSSLCFSIHHVLSDKGSLNDLRMERRMKDQEYMMPKHLFGDAFQINQHATLGPTTGTLRGLVLMTS